MEVCVDGNGCMRNVIWKYGIMGMGVCGMWSGSMGMGECGMQVSERPELSGDQRRDQSPVAVPGI